MQYGLPYMGAKAKIAPSLAMCFPKADHFYDLFGGGGSITHYMVMHKSNKYAHFHYNEIKTQIVDCFQKAINGEFNYNTFKPPWISREEFDAKKATDGYVCVCWSFGNNGDNYLFSTDIEEYKRAMHMAVVFDDFNQIAREVLGCERWPAIAKTIKQRRLYLRQKIEFFRKRGLPKCLLPFLSEKQKESIAAHRPFQQLEQLEQLKRLQQLEQLERLERLEQLERLERLSCTSKDYREVEILPNSVVYCDIPYQGTAEYGSSFSHKEFFDWAASREFPVYISEYNISDPRFKLRYSIGKLCGLLRNGDNKLSMMEERLYWNGK